MNILSWVAGAGLVIGVLEIGAHSTRVDLLRWPTEARAYVWLPAIIVLFVLVARHDERKVFNGTLCERFRLGVEETMVFSWFLMHGTVWWRAQEFRRDMPLRVLAKADRPFYGTPYLRVRLTNKRLAFGSLLGYTWRVIPLTDLCRLTKVPRKSIFKPAMIKVEYEFGGRTEALVVALNSIRGPRFARALSSTTGIPAD